MWHSPFYPPQAVRPTRVWPPIPAGSLARQAGMPGLVVAILMGMASSACSGAGGRAVSRLTDATPPAPYTRPRGAFLAPDFPPGLAWFNVKHPLTMRGLRGKIVLLDFWTYGCINCIHIIPELKDLEQRFHGALVVIGVHSPKFVAERSDAGVKAAVLRYKLDHPVVNDAQLSLWRALGVTVWPTVVLIDPDGYVVGGSEGEGVEAQLLPAINRVAAAYRAAGRLDTRPLSLALASAAAPPSTLSFPGKILADPAGHRLFVADSGHDRIVVVGLDGKIQQVIGSGHTGRADGSFSQASFHTPEGMALVGHLLYIADMNNHLIRCADLDQKTVSTVAGTGQQDRGAPGAGNAVQQAISSPWALDFLRGWLYIAMAGDHRIWRYDPVQHYIQPFAGSGEEGRIDGPLRQAAFAQPSGLADDGRSLYVADSESSSIRQIDLDRGLVTTLAGGNLFDFGLRNGVGLAARFQHPLGLALAGGTLFIADTYNSVIRTLSLATGQVGTLVGPTIPAQDGEPAERFFEPGGLSIFGNTLYVADTDNGLIRAIQLPAGTVTTLPVR